MLTDHTGFKPEFDASANCLSFYVDDWDVVGLLRMTPCYNDQHELHTSSTRL